MRHGMFPSRAAHDPAAVKQVEDRLEEKWSPRRTLLFAVAASAGCWAAILFAVYLLV